VEGRLQEEHRDGEEDLQIQEPVEDAPPAAGVGA